MPITMKSSPLGTETASRVRTETTASETTTIVNRDEERRLRGLARELNFTDEQYEEALKRISSPTDANQLLVALIDVSSTKQQSATMNDTNPIQQQHQQQQQQFESSSSASSSCYSSITSFVSSSNTSSSNQSLDSLPYQHQNQLMNIATVTSSQTDSICSLPASQMVSAMANSVAQVDHLRKIYIDGSNVARTHGKDAHFSWLGIKICVDWFSRRQHKVKVFVPMEKCCPQLSPLLGTPSMDDNIIDYLTQLDALVKTPTGCNDDLFIIEAAKHNNGVIVSNDLYRDEKRRLNDAELEQFIYLNRLPYIFVDDLFIPAPDPRGRSGPTLGEFLLAPISTGGYSTPTSGHNHKKLFRTKSHQRSGTQRNHPNLSSQYHHNQLQQQQSEYNQHLYHKSLQATRSLPADQIGRPPSQMQFYGGAASQAGQAPSCPSGQLISISRTNYLHSNDSQYREPQSIRANLQTGDSQNGKQQLRKSISIAYGNTMATSAREPTLAVASSEPIDSQDRRRHATPLCRTKSHI